MQKNESLEDYLDSIGKLFDTLSDDLEPRVLIEGVLNQHLNHDIALVFERDPEQGKFLLLARSVRVEFPDEKVTFQDDKVNQALAKLLGDILLGRSQYEIEDVSKDRALKDNLAIQSFSVASFSIFAIYDAFRHVIGCLFVAFRQPQKFSEITLSKINLIAKVVSYILHNSQQNAKEQENKRLSEANRSVVDRRTLQATLQQVTIQAIEITNPKNSEDDRISYISLIEPREHDNKIFLHYVASNPPHVLNDLQTRDFDWLEFSKLSGRDLGIVGHVAKTNTSYVYAPDVHLNKYYREFRSATKSQISVLLDVALEGKVGILTIESTEVDSFSPVAINKLLRFSSTVAPLIRKELILNELSLRKNAFDALQQIPHALVSVEDPNEIVRVIAKHVCQVAQADWVSVIQINLDDNDEFTHIHYWEDVTRDGKPYTVKGTIRKKDGKSVDAIRRKKAIVIDNVQKEKNVNPRMLNAKSAICLPLYKAPEIAIGVMWIHYQQEYHHFSDAEIKDWQIFANYVASVYVTSQHHYNQQKLSNALTSVISYATTNRTTDEILWHAVDKAKILVETSTDTTKPVISYFALLTDQGLSFSDKHNDPNTLTNIKKSIKGSLIPLEGPKRTGVIGHVIRKLQQQGFTDDTPPQDRYVWFRDTKQLKNHYIPFFKKDGKPIYGSQIAVPVFVGGNIYGVLSVEHEDKHEFDIADAKNLALLANHVGVAIQTNHLLDITKKQEQKSAELLNISVELLNMVNDSRMFEIVIDQAVKRLHAQSGSIFLYDENKRYFVPIASSQRKNLSTVTRYGEGIAGHLLESYEKGETQFDQEQVTTVQVNERIKVVIIKNYNMLPERFKKSIYKFEERHHPNVLVTLITSNAKPLGVFYLDAELDRNFNESDAKSLTQFENDIVTILEKMNKLNNVLSRFPPQIFLSYYHEDKRWVEQLRQSLGPLEGSRLRMWDMSWVEPGSAWPEMISQAIAWSHAAVLIVTRNYINQIHQEDSMLRKHEFDQIMKAVEEDQLRLLWIAAEACLFDHTPFGKYHALNDPSRPLEGMNDADLKSTLTEIARKIDKQMHYN